MQTPPITLNIPSLPIYFINDPVNFSRFLLVEYYNILNNPPPQIIHHELINPKQYSPRLNSYSPKNRSPRRSRSRSPKRSSRKSRSRSRSPKRIYSRSRSRSPKESFIKVTCPFWFFAGKDNIKPKYWRRGYANFKTVRELNPRGDPLGWEYKNKYFWSSYNHHLVCKRDCADQQNWLYFYRENTNVDNFIPISKKEAAHLIFYRDINVSTFHTEITKLNIDR